MRFAVFIFIGLVSAVATCLFYGWLESATNMIEGLGQLFAPGATTILFSPFLLLFIFLSLAVFIGGPLLAVAATAAGGGLLLRTRGLPVSRSYARSFVFVAASCQLAAIFIAAEQDAWFLVQRPRVHPGTPLFVLALLSVANALINLFIASLIIRKLTTKTNRVA